MNKTTLYLPDDLKQGVERLARATGVSEAQVIRDAIAARVRPVRPQPGVFSAADLRGADAETMLEGFGER